MAGKATNAGGALEGMEGAKDAIDPLGGKSFAFDRDQIIGRLRDELARFGYELLVQSGHVGTPVEHGRMAQQVSSRDRLDQIEIGARLPGVLPTSCCPASVVITKAGRVATSEAPRRSARKKENPSILGMLTSTIKRSKGCASTFSMASMPLMACSISKPAFSSVSR